MGENKSLDCILREISKINLDLDTLVPSNIPNMQAQQIQYNHQNTPVEVQNRYTPLVNPVQNVCYNNQTDNLDHIIENVVHLSKQIMISKPINGRNVPHYEPELVTRNCNYDQTPLHQEIKEQAKPISVDISNNDRDKENIRARFERHSSRNNEIAQSNTSPNNVGVSPMKYQPNFSIKGEDKSIKESFIDEEVKEENSSKNNLIIQKAPPLRKVSIGIGNNEEIKERENRFTRRSSVVRMRNNGQQANNFQNTLNHRGNKTPQRVSSLEDVYRGRKVEPRGNVQLSSKFINLPTNIF